MLRSRVHEIDNDWKPSFLLNGEFTHIILEVNINVSLILSLTQFISILQY